MEKSQHRHDDSDKAYAELRDALTRTAACDERRRIVQRAEMPEYLIVGGIDLENQIHTGVRNHARRRAARNPRALGAQEAANERRGHRGEREFPIARAEGKALREGGKKAAKPI